MNTLCFYKSFLRNVRSHLGEPARLTGPAHLHRNSLLMFFVNLFCPYNKDSRIFQTFGIFQDLLFILKFGHFTYAEAATQMCSQEKVF